MLANGYNEYHDIRIRNIMREEYHGDKNTPVLSRRCAGGKYDEGRPAASRDVADTVKGFEVS